MKALEIRKILQKKKKKLQLKIRTTDDLIRKKKARKKYFKIKSILKERDDIKLEFWFRRKKEEIMLRKSINQRVQEWVNSGHLFGRSPARDQ
jgi:hypothetical protein